MIVTPIHTCTRQNKAPEAKTKFQAIAKAYQVLMNETHRELYHHFQANPDVSSGVTVESINLFIPPSGLSTDRLILI